MSKSPPSKTIEQLEGVVEDRPEFDSYLSGTCHRLREKPIDRFTVEDLRIMLGQNIGTVHLLPRALDLLEQSPLAAGDFYPGDLLSAVLKLPESYWQTHPAHLRRIQPIASRARDRLQKTAEKRRRKAAQRAFRNLTTKQEAHEDDHLLRAIQSFRHRFAD